MIVVAISVANCLLHYLDQSISLVEPHLGRLVQLGSSEEEPLPAEK